MTLQFRVYSLLIFFFGLSNFLCPADVTYSTNTTLTSDLRLYLTQRAIFNATLTLDGAGFFYQFPINSDQVLVVNNGFTATLTNLLLNDFNTANLSIGTGSTLAIGDNSYISMKKDITIGSSDPSITCTGNCEINGNGATLTVNKSQGITINGTSKTLTLKNLRLVTSQADALKCLSSTCKIKLQNVVWVITSNFAFSAGSCDVSGIVVINADLGATANPVTFLNWEWTSSGTMTVTNSSELALGYGVNFKYNADPTGAANFNATKRRFLLNQFGSKLTFSGASFESTATGLALDQGIINIYDEVIFKPSTSTAAELEIAKNVQINLSGSGNLNIQGPVKYTDDLPLKYGDSIALQHSVYGNYLSYDTGSPNYYAITKTTLSDFGRWYVEPGDSDYRFGNPTVVGVNVKSGDFVRLEPYTAIAGYTTYIGALWLAYPDGQHIAAPTSSPNPPYSLTFAYTTRAGQASLGFNCMLRMFKFGGVVGEPIYLGDSVYLVNYDADPTGYSTSNYSTKALYYLGSSNLTYSSNFETYSYKVSTVSRPSNLESNLTWKIAELNIAAYTTAPGRTDPIGWGSAAYTAYTAQWPTASSMQF